jgi:hypothetical protein
MFQIEHSPGSIPMHLRQKLARRLTLRAGGRRAGLGAMKLVEVGPGHPVLGDGDRRQEEPAVGDAAGAGEEQRLTIAGVVGRGGEAVLVRGAEKVSRREKDVRGGEIEVVAGQLRPGEWQLDFADEIEKADAVREVDGEPWVSTCGATGERGRIDTHLQPVERHDQRLGGKRRSQISRCRRPSSMSSGSRLSLLPRGRRPIRVPSSPRSENTGRTLGAFSAATDASISTALKTSYRNDEHGDFWFNYVPIRDPGGPLYRLYLRDTVPFEAADGLVPAPL